MTSQLPSVWEPDHKLEVVEEICERIASGESLNKILSDSPISPNIKYPTYRTFMRWVEDDDALCQKYARAMECRTEVHVDEIIDIADMPPQAYQNATGGYQVDPAWVAHQKQRIDSRKWVSAKLKPKKYGDKVQQEHTGKDGGAIELKAAVSIYLPQNGRDNPD